MRAFLTVVLLALCGASAAQTSAPLSPPDNSAAPPAAPKPAARPASGTDDKVYRYKDASGVIHYTDKPPTKDAKPVALPELQTYRSKQVRVPRAAPPVPQSKPANFDIAINSPTPDETVRNNSTDIPVSVTVLPSLTGGYGLRYALDGKDQNDAPTAETSFTLHGAERGQHTITVSLIGPAGEQVAATSINVNMMQPTVKKN